MIKAINSKTFDNLKGGVRDGMDTAWKASRRMRFRSPVVYEKPSPTGSWAGLGLLAVAALALGAWLYYRKRKEVADRYTMGGSGEPAETGSEWDNIPAAERMPN